MRSSIRRSIRAAVPRLFLFTSLVLLSSSTTAQLAELVADLQVEEELSLSSGGSSNPKDFVVRGSVVFFVARDAGGPALWVTDGTPNGTRAVLSRVTAIVAVDEDDLWVARGNELWWTNGSADGDALHRFLGPLADQYTAQQIDGDRLLLSYSDPDFSAIVADNASFERLGDGPAFTPVFTRNKLFYKTPGGGVGVSDGTESGTRIVHPSLVGASVGELVASSGAVYWLSQDEGTSLWRSYGVGAELVAAGETPALAGADFLVGTPSGLSWIAGEQVLNLWRIRDDQPGPRQATSFTNANSFRFGGEPPSLLSLLLEEAESGIYFNQVDEDDDEYLWFLSDQSAQPRKIVSLCRECSAQVLSSSGDSLLFTVAGLRDPVIWHSDSTSGGTNPLLECGFSSCGTVLEGFGLLTSVRVVDGSFTPTLVRIDPSDGEVDYLAETGSIFDHGGRVSGAYLPPSTLVLKGELPDGEDPFSVDLVSGETALLANIGVSEEPSPRFVDGLSSDLAFLLPTSTYTFDLGTTLGSQGQTVVLGDVFEDCAESSQARRISAKVLCISRAGGLVSLDLEGGWRQVLLPSVPEGRIAILNGEVGLITNPSFASADLWGTDGTTAGTILLASVDGGMSFLVAESSIAYLVVVDGVKRGVLETDGTLAGTRTLVPLAEHSARFRFQRLVVTEDWLYEWELFGSRLVRIDRETGEEQDVAPSELLAQNGSLVTVIGAGDAVEILFTAGQRTERHRLTDESDVAVFQHVVQEPLYFSVGESYRLDGKTLLFQQDRLLELNDDGSYREEEFRLSSNVAGDSRAAFFAGHTGDRGVELWTIDASSRARLLHDIKPGPASSAPRDFTVAGRRLYFVADDGIHDREIWTLPLGGAGCSPTDHSLCLGEGRFKIDVAWEDFNGNRGRGRTRPVTDDTGAFWYFDGANLEAVAKVIDGTALNEHYWSFFGSLSNVAFALTVTDSETGFARRYRNPAGTFASVGDVQSLGRADSSEADPASETQPLIVASTEQDLDTRPCRGGGSNSTFLCLRDDRFEVSVSWLDFFGNSGEGMARALEHDTGSFWFFEEKNLELVVKALDGRAINGHHWIFYGALTNVAFELRVRDTVSGLTRVYSNPLRTFASHGDTSAFPE